MNYDFNIYEIFIFCVCILLSGCEPEVIQKDIDTEVERLYAEYALPSLAVGVFTESGMEWTKQLGYADTEHSIPINEETIYHIGSISKLFIVTAVMQLEEQGKLDLDIDINTYLPVDFRHPDFPAVPITTRMLLTHTAGMSKPGTFDSQLGMWNPFDPDQGPAPSVWVPEFLLPGGAHYDAHLWQAIPPGEYEIYSNIGACVAAYIVEKLSGMDFRQYCKENIFTPLQMYNTSYNYADLDQKRIALLYDRQGHGSTYFDNRVYAAGGAKSTVRDLSQFALCYLNKGAYNGTRILSEASVRKILELQNQASGRCLIWQAYAGGWYGHTGGLELGTSTTLVIHPGSKTGFILFTNTHSSVVHPGGDLFWLIRQKANAYID